MARQPMVKKSFYVPPKLWDDAMAKAAERADNLPDELRKFLHRYVDWDESKHHPASPVYGVRLSDQGSLEGRHP